MVFKRNTGSVITQNCSLANATRLRYLLLLVSLLFSNAQCANAEPVDYDVIERVSGADFAHGYAFEQQGKYDEALHAYTRAINSNPVKMDPYIHRANILLQLKRYREALSDVNQYAKILEQTRENDDKLFQSSVAMARARALDGLGQADDALSSYKKALELKESVSAHSRLGDFYKRHGEKELALQELHKAQTMMTPKAGWSNYNYGKEAVDVQNSIKELEGGKKNSKSHGSLPEIGAGGK